MSNLYLIVGRHGECRAFNVVDKDDKANAVSEFAATNDARMYEVSATELKKVVETKESALDAERRKNRELLARFEALEAKVSATPAK